MCLDKKNLSKQKRALNLKPVPEKKKASGTILQMIPYKKWNLSVSN